MRRNKIIMVYPVLGLSGRLVKHAPIGLLYACSQLVDKGFEILIFDSRLYPDTWREELAKLIDERTLIVGISVMTGKPILNALEIDAHVKGIDPEVKVVWGGPYATFHPDYILRDDPNCDYVVSGYGSVPFAALVDCVAREKAPENIPGVYYREDDEIKFAPADWSCHEFIHYQDIPYDLIEDYSVYGQFDQDKRIFSIYSAMGCAYKCAFCSSPALYKHIKGPHWAPFGVQEIVDHVEFVIDKYDASYIYFIDDDSFVRLKHVENIIDEIERRGLHVKLGFRGARINEIKKMSHEFIDKLIHAGTDILHIGAESGSNRILKLVRKDCTVDDILACNDKLAQHEELTSLYNFIVGLPTETMDDLKATSRLMLQLYEENPRCLISIPNKFRPLPGTELFALAQREWGFELPKNLVDWAEIAVEGKYSAPWLTPEMKRFIDMMIMTSYFVDSKINKITSGKSMFFKFMRLVDVFYGPVARFRLRHGFDKLLAEKLAYDVAQKYIGQF